MKTIGAFVGVAFSAIVGIGVGPVSAQTIQWDLTNEYQPTSLIGQGDTFFAEKVKELSEGRIVITNHFSGALGFNSKDVLDAVSRGAVPLGDASTVFWGGIEPVFQLSGLPFVTADVDESHKLFELAKPLYESVLLKYNQYLLFVSPWPPSGIWSRNPLPDVDSIKGLAIRTYDPASTETFRSVGSAPQQLAWADVVPLLATNGISAVLTSADGGVGQRFWEYVKNFSEINYAMPLSMATINKDEFDKLSDADKKAVRDAAAATQERQWAALRGRVEENYATMTANGVTIAKPTTEMQAAFKAASKSIVDAWVVKMGDEGKAVMEAFTK